jgi:hypothetical protein
MCYPIRPMGVVSNADKSYRIGIGMRVFAQKQTHLHLPAQVKASSQRANAAPPNHSAPRVHHLQRVLGNQRILRLLRTNSEAHTEAAVRISPGPGGHAPVSVQRFDEGEHKAIGDAAAGGRTIFLAPGMPVTYGEVVSLAGDYFGDWPTLRNLAKHEGITEGTRGEVWYAVLVKVRTNAEGTDEKKAEADGLGKFFDRKAKDAVNARFMSLAVNNIAHFPNPKKGDAARPQAVKDAGAQAIGGGASYRSNHANALLVAAAIGADRPKPPTPHAHQFGAGQGTDHLNDALMLEAFADHFLTDAFSSGHQQTERASIKEYWDQKLPNFSNNFQNWLAQAIVLQVRKKNRIAAAITPQWVRDKIALPSVLLAMAKIPKLSFGDVVSDIIHDYFNQHGAEAEVAGRRINLVGDKHLLTKAVPHASLSAKEQEFQPKDDQVRHVTDQSKDTFDAATLAVKAGIAEVHEAHALGQKGEDPQRVPDKILQAGGGAFAAEQLMPKLTPDAAVQDAKLKAINWQLNSYKEILADSRMLEGLSLSMEKYSDMVADSLSSLPPDQMEAVTVALTWRLKGGAESVKSLVNEVINYAPLSAGGVDPDLLPEIVEVKHGAR